MVLYVAWAYAQEMCDAAPRTMKQEPLILPLLGRYAAERAPLKARTRALLSCTAHITHDVEGYDRIQVYPMEFH